MAFTNVLNILIAFLLGASFASLFNQFIYRKENNWSLKGRSKCEKCKVDIHPKYLIPVLGYVLTSGRCSNCGYKIPPLYPISELLMGIGLAILYWQHASIIYILFFILLSYLALYDVNYQRIPKRITDFIVLASIIAGIIIHGNNLNYALILTILLILIMFVFAKWFGMGDLLVILSGSMLLSFSGLFNWLCISFLLGGIYASYVLIMRFVFHKNLKKEIPFIPFLWLGFLLANFFNPFLYFYGILY